MRVALEPGLTDAPDLAGLDLHTGFAHAQETLGAVNWLQVQVGQLGPEIQAGLHRELEKFREGAARRLDQIAEQLEGGPGAVPPRSLEPGSQLDALDSLVTAGPAADPKVREVVTAAHGLQEHITQLGAHLLAAAPQPAELP